jgi:Arc/MetJ-type ribon-helix-helix transcriptional regulator
MKRAGANQNEPKVRINVVITGEPALWIIEWKRRGLVTSNSDAVIQALRALYEKISEIDLRTVQLRNYRKVEEE